ncbi:MAG: PTS glucose transporter subunit IIA, partial [Spirochaetaceae bacterium]|nr:PTS glucose transporter subunit IIA [Spirochaetaceae bacterium]
MGGSMTIDGNLVQGAQNIFFAELASKSTEVFSVSATRFMSGKFPFMIFGLPAAAFAMYQAARPEKKKVVGSILISAGITSLLTGITEPIEFTFLFVAPVMYAVHCVLAGLSFMLMHIFNVGVGMTFSGGLIDLTLFGVLQGNAKTHWIWVVIVGVVYAVVYYFVFYTMITKLNLKTPGREADDEETKLYTRKDVNARKEASQTSALILEGLGGKKNLSDLDCCATRLRVTVVDPTLVRDDLLKASGAAGVIHKGNGIQVIYGPRVANVKSNLELFLETPEADKIGAAEPKAPNQKILSAYMNGEVKELKEVEDEAFSTGVLGNGVAIEPSEGKLFAPCDAKVDMVFDTKHAINLVTDDGVEILLHIGIDTIKLGGKYYEAHVKNGDSVKKGDLLISFDLAGIKGEGYKATTPMIICNSDNFTAIKSVATGAIKAGKDILSVQ